MSITKKVLMTSLLLSLFSCSSTFYRDETAEKVDIQRFMGKWYVIAHIPTFVEKGAYNALETYTLNKEGEIDVDFRYNKDSFDGELKTLPQLGWVYDQETKAHWKIRPFWPLKFDYLIHYLSEDYGATVIGVPDHTYLWFMSRTPELSEEQRAQMEEIAEALGYDLSKLREIPHKWD